MKAMILAAGFGTRLGELSKKRPKPMLPLGDKPIIGHLVSSLATAGIKEIAVNLHYKGELIRQYLQDGSQWGVKIHYSNEEGQILGTGGGVKKLAPWFGKDDVLVLNGKIATDIDFAKIISFHRQKNPLATMVLKPDAKAGKWGSFKTDSSGIIKEMLGTDTQGNSVESGPFMFSGIQILSSDFIAKLPQGASCLVRQGYKPFFAQGEKLAGWEMSPRDYWWEHSTISRYFQGCLNILELPGYGISQTLPSELNTKFQKKDSAKVIIAGDLKVENQISLGDNVIIGHGSHLQGPLHLENCIIWPRTMVKKSLDTVIAFDDEIVKVNLQTEGPYTGPALKK